MSTREALYDMLRARLDDEHANRCLDAYRAEVLREARREILAASLVADDLKARPLWIAGYKGGLDVAAFICTPEPAPPAP